MSGARLVVFPFLLLMLPVVAVLAWWLKRRYAAAIVRLQKAACAPETAHEVSATAPASKPSCAHEALPTLTLSILPAHTVAKDLNGVDCTAAPRRLRRRVLSVQLSSGLLYWCALLLFFMWMLAGQQVLNVLMSSSFWPSLLVVVLLPASIAWFLQAGLHRALMNVAALIVLMSAFGLFLYKGGTEWQSSMLGFSLGYTSIAVMVSAFLRPAVRGAGVPLIIAGIVGWLVLTSVFAGVLALEDSPDDAETTFFEDAVGVMALLLTFAAAAWCGWRVLMHLSVRYAAKRFSDMQLTLGVYWALMTAFMLGGYLNNPFVYLWWSKIAEWVCAILVFWLSSRWLQSLALRRAVRTALPSIGALLFLRVFKPSRRSEEFTDRFFAYWRFSSPVWMIAGPDLAGAYMEPNEFFAYLRGRLREHFIAAPGEAAARVQALDNARDPDGRFRINELFCTNNTWQPTVLQMIAHAGVILLDLREYSQQRKGTRYELTELLRRAPLNKVLMLIDAKDDVTRFTAEVESIWREVEGSRSDVAGFGDLQVLQFSKGSNAEMHGLFRVTAQAATT